jgi:hypothetical protein
VKFYSESISTEGNQQFRLLKKCISILIIWIAVSILYAVRIPMGYKSFWAEDGSLFYQGAVEGSFVETLKSPTAGYLLLVGRIGGKITSYFPIEYVTIVNFMIATFVMALCIVTLFYHSRTLVSKISLRVLAAIGVAFIPIANFDSLANLANLHFTLPFVVLVILISAQKSSKTSLLSVLLIILACLSDPLCIFCLPALINTQKVQTRFTLSINKSLYSKVYLASIAIQIVFTAMYLMQGARSIGQEHSVIKTTYLFLDRVVGSTFIPGWGHVSSLDFTGDLFMAKLLGRAGIAAVILGIWIVLYRKLIAKKVTDQGHLLKNQVILFQLLASSLAYWFTVGIIFNPEPRYGIFPALCLMIAATVIVDRYSSTMEKPKSRKLTVWIFCASISTTWILSWSPSAHRITGPQWSEEIVKALKHCTNSNSKSAKLQILPGGDNWYVEVPCSSLIKD